MSAPRAELRDVTEAAGLVWQPSARWIRGRINRHDVVDSTEPLLSWEKGSPFPRYVFPLEEIDQDRIRPSSDAPPSGHDSRAEWFDLERDDGWSRHAAWAYAAEELKGYVCFAWDAMDTWLEEDEEIIGHARDPYHRIDVRRSSRHVRISLEGTTLAETDRPLLLFETGLPTRYYLAPEDVDTELLEPTDRTTVCPYKGVASYFSVRIGDSVHENLAWTYRDPYPAHGRIAERIAFFDERVDVEVDGEKQERPHTIWS